MSSGQRIRSSGAPVAAALLSLGLAIGCESAPKSTSPEKSAPVAPAPAPNPTPLKQPAPVAGKEAIREVAIEPSYKIAKSEAGAAPTHVPAVVFASDGGRLLSVTSDGNLIVWNSADRAIEKTRKLGEKARAAAVVPGRVAGVLDESVVRAFDPRTGEAIGVADGIVDARALAASSDGKYVAIARGDGAIELRVVPGLRLAKIVGDAHKGEVTNLTMSPDSKSLASVGGDGALRIWSIPDLERNESSGDHGRLHAVAFSPDGARVAFGGETNEVRELNVKTLATRVIASGQPYWITALGYRPDGKVIAVGDESCDIWLFRTDTEKPELVFHGKHHNECWLSSVTWAPDGERFLFGCRPNQHGGPVPTMVDENMYAEAYTASDVKTSVAEREAALDAAWRAWSTGANSDLRASVRAAIEKRLGFAPGKGDDAAVERSERQWLAGGPIGAGRTERLMGGGLSVEAGYTYNIKDFTGPRLALTDPGTAGGQGGAGGALIFDEGPGPGVVNDPELLALRERASADATLKQSLSQAERARTRESEVVGARVKELRESFLINEWRMPKDK